MKLLAVRTARIIVSISTEELNPRGLVIYPSLIQGLIEKYNFDTYPIEKFDETKGITFANGNWNGISIEKVTIFGDGIVIDTRSSTNDSETIFNEAIQWASESFGLTYSPEMVSAKIYISELILYSDVTLNNLNPVLQAFSAKLSSAINSFNGLSLNYELASTGFSYDSSQDKSSIAAFRVDRLDNSAYSENKYYSVAPLPTEEHIKFLEEFEAIISGNSVPETSESDNLREVRF